MDAARDGLELWAGSVVPALLPFLIAAEAINSTGFTRVFGILLEPVMRPLFRVPGIASFALVMGVSSGYPVGAKITSDLRNNGLLTRVEAERLLAFTNNSGPLFIVGVVGSSMCGSPETGTFLLACHLLACITVGLLYRFYGNNEKQIP
ncbi:MAG: nucleoside recognition domain-containing protein [Acetivibrionales bacterium]